MFLYFYVFKILVHVREDNYSYLDWYFFIENIIQKRFRKALKIIALQIYYLLFVKLIGDKLKVSILNL